MHVKDDRMLASQQRCASGGCRRRLPSSRFCARSGLRLGLIALLLVAHPLLAATEIAAGSMLGPRYKQTAFYMRTSTRGEWRQTYTDPRYRGKARGKLMMLRLAQGLFQDEWMTEHPFDPDANTNRLIEALDIYKDHGILAFSVSLQGGNPGYDPKVNGISRRNAERYGSSEGLLVSAFRSDGSLKPEWLAPARAPVARSR